MKLKTVSKVLAVLLSAAVTMPVMSSVYFSVSAQSAVSSSWSVSDSGSEAILPNYVQTAFDEAMEEYSGEKLVPLTYYGIQVVAGYNYYLICRQISEDGTEVLKNVVIYDPKPVGDPSQKGKINRIMDFNIEDYAHDYQYDLLYGNAPGSVGIPSSLNTCILPYDARIVYNKVFSYLNGISCQPLAYLGKQQTNDGTDYALLCCQNAVTSYPNIFIDVVILHESLNGETYIKSSYSILGERTTYSTELENTSYILTNSTITLGGTVTLKTQAEGGQGDYTYAVLYKKKTDTKWTVKQNYSTNDTITIKPAKATDYDVCVKVKDSEGTIVKKFFTVKVNAKLANTSTISATTIKKGSTVTLKASATGGVGNYTYAVLYKKKSETKWTVRQNYKDNTEILVRPYTSTDYDICIKVQDEDGTIVKKFFTVKVQ